MSGTTIIGLPWQPARPLRSMLLDEELVTEVPDAEDASRLFKIRAADSYGHRSSANILINRMYAMRGYKGTPLTSHEAPNRITLMATEKDETLGTITIGFDSAQGLLVDDLFRDQVNALRDVGRRLCEFTKLAMDRIVRSKRVLASLFHVAYIYAHRIKGMQALLIEVNPRHVRYYERMLGFEVKSEPRLNTRVNAPAVLLVLDFAHAHRQIQKFGGKPQLADRERSLYPYFFSVAEEAGIVGRLSRP